MRPRSGEFIDQTFQLAKDFHALLAEEEDFSTPYFPQSNILCFHYNKFSEDDDFQKRLRYAIINEKRFYITSCEMNGRRYLRVVLLHPDTTTEHLKQLIEEVKRVAQILV